jgi:hypothetical protein
MQIVYRAYLFTVGEKLVVTPRFFRTMRGFGVGFCGKSRGGAVWRGAACCAPTGTGISIRMRKNKPARNDPHLVSAPSYALHRCVIRVLFIFYLMSATLTAETLNAQETDEGHECCSTQC